MVCLDNSILVDQRLGMASKSVNSNDPYMKLKQINHSTKKKNSLSFTQSQLNIPACDQSGAAVIDVVILIVVICACGILLYPYLEFLVIASADFFEEIVYVFKEEFCYAPMVFACFGVSILFAVLALIVITVYTGRTCGKPGCRGLRKAAEFDIQLETEECVKNSSTTLGNLGIKNGMFQLPRDHHRELEAELKKMAPPNGRAVLVFRARCGCSVGRLEVPGSRKSRKVKK